MSGRDSKALAAWLSLIDKTSKASSKREETINHKISTFPLRNWTKEIHASLVWEICKSPGLAAFDFDNTLIRNDFGEAVMNSLIADGLTHVKENFPNYFRNKTKAQRILKVKEKNPELLRKFVWDEYQFLMQTQGVEKAYRWSSFIFSGWKERKISSYAKKIWKAHLNEKNNPANVRPYREMVGLIKFLIEKDWQVYIVTASPEPIIRKVAPVFLVPKENVIGMRQIEKDGISTPDLVEPYTYGDGKVSAFYAKTQTYPDLAFGDSENDFPLLKSAKRFGVLIDKGNQELANKCRANNCLIQPVFPST